MKALFSAMLLLGSTLSATAQTAAEPEFHMACQDNSWGSNRATKQYCETRDLTLNTAAGQALTVEGGPNGGITVHGWDGPNVRVRAKVQSWATSEATAQATVRRLVIGTTDNTLRATDPANDHDWSVSYEIFVPRLTALVLNTVNGGISLDNVQADIRFQAVNGGVTLANLGGQVSGHTVNGGLTIDLTGRQWTGKGLDVQTTNGGIHWKLPRDYSAQFFTSTNIGSIHTDLPVTKTGLMHREVEASLGKGGAPVRAVTTNGGISVTQAQGRN